MKIKNEAYFYEMNIVRGISVFLVVVGHIVTQSNTNDIAINKLFNIIGIIIYSFHMHVFFFLSGFLGSESLSLTLNKKQLFLKKKFSRLIIPYFTMGALYIPIKIILSNYSRKPFYIGNIWKMLIGENPDAALWFLYSLFIISAIVCLLVRNSTINMAIIIATLLYVSSFFIHTDVNILKTLMVYPLFYLLGIKTRLNYEYYKQIIYIKKIIWLSGIFLIIGTTLLYYYQISSISPIMTLSGMLLVLSISYEISLKKSYMNNFFYLLANYSMDIFILSEPVKVAFRIILKAIKVSEIISPLIIFLFTLFLPILLSNVFIRKFRNMRLLFLGISD